MHLYHVLYKTTNLLNGKFYIGKHSTSDLDDGYLGSGRLIVRSISKYGKISFRREILVSCDDEDFLELLERTVVDERVLQDPLCMNLASGGQGGRAVALLRTVESYKLGHEKAALKTRGRTKENHQGRRMQAEKISKALKGRRHKPYVEPERNIFAKNSPSGERSSRSILTDEQTHKLRMMSLFMKPKQIHQIFSQLSYSGVKSVIARFKVQHFLTHNPAGC